MNAVCTHVFQFPTAAKRARLCVRTTSYVKLLVHAAARAASCSSCQDDLARAFTTNGISCKHVLAIHTLLAPIMSIYSRTSVANSHSYGHLRGRLSSTVRSSIMSVPFAKGWSVAVFGRFACWSVMQVRSFNKVAPHRRPVS